MGIYTRYYTPREARWWVYRVIYTQGGYVVGIHPMVHPWEARWEAYPLYIHTLGG